MRCTACRYDKCVSVGMASQTPRSDNGKEEDGEVEILLDSKSEAKPEAEPVSQTDKDKDRSQLGEYLKVVCCGMCMMEHLMTVLPEILFGALVFSF